MFNVKGETYHKGQMTNNVLQNNTQKPKYWETQTRKKNRWWTQLLRRGRQFLRINLILFLLLDDLMKFNLKKMNGVCSVLSALVGNKASKSSFEISSSAKYKWQHDQEVKIGTRPCHYYYMYHRYVYIEGKHWCYDG